MTSTSAIEYKINAAIDASELIDLYESAGLDRPCDLLKVRKMLIHAKLTVSAWKGRQLVGIARCLSDFSYCCMLADLAVHSSYQKNGIGSKLLEITIKEAEEGAIMLVLASGASRDFLIRKGFKNTPEALMLRV
jgi:N-acetylglutamate synthase-like GNAT family acetyltransferase